MGTIEITTEPHELIINGTTVLMQGDPSAGKAWGQLLDLELSFKTEDEREQLTNTLTETLAGMAETDSDAETFRKMGLGIVTLRKVAKLYVEAVTGFPTQPSASSKKP